MRNTALRGLLVSLLLAWGREKLGRLEHLYFGRALPGHSQTNRLWSKARRLLPWCNNLVKISDIAHFLGDSVSRDIAVACAPDKKNGQAMHQIDRVARDESVGANAISAPAVGYKLSSACMIESDTPLQLLTPQGLIQRLVVHGVCVSMPHRQTRNEA